MRPRRDHGVAEAAHRIHAIPATTGRNEEAVPGRSESAISWIRTLVRVSHHYASIPIRSSEFQKEKSTYSVHEWCAQYLNFLSR